MATIIRMTLEIEIDGEHDNLAAMHLCDEALAEFEDKFNKLGFSIHDQNVEFDYV